MSDRPPNDREDAAPLAGGWSQPRTPSGSAWRAPQKKQEESVEGWRGPALPRDIKEEPENDGDWHLPSPEDTTFKPDDEIEITDEQRPEDQLMELAALVSENVEQELLDDTGDAPVAPEDLIYMIENTDVEEEPENPQMSELMALASLVEDQPQADLSMTELDEDLESQQLSPAERVMMASKETPQETEDTSVGEATASDAPVEIDEDDPGAYARRQLQQLGLEGDEEEEAEDEYSAPATRDITSFDEAVDDPAAYARQQLAQLGQDAPPAQDASPAQQTQPSPPQPEPLDPRKIELGRQFAEVEQRVKQMRQQVQTGQMTQDEFVNQLRELMINDDEGNWWIMGVETDTWYRSENNNWVEDDPEPLAVYREQQRRDQGSGYQPVEDSLPRLTEHPQPDQQEGGIRVDENFMPLPAEAPINDPDATVAGPAAFGDVRAAEAETVPDQSYYDQTVPAEPQAVDYGMVESPAPQSATTMIDLDGGTEDEIYQQAAENQRQNYTQYGLIGIVALIIAMAACGTLYTFLATNWYDSIAGEWEPAIIAAASLDETQFRTVTINDSTGREIASISGGGNDRRPLDSLDQVSDEFIHAILTLTDPDYYAASAWGPASTAVAYFNDTTSGEIDNPNSVIVNSVVEDLVFTNAVGAEGGPTQADLVIAGVELRDAYTLDEILLLYLNQMLFFGNQTTGVEAAAQYYLDKAAAELNVADAAFLAGIAQDPLNNDPVNNRARSFALMRQTLDRMAEQGCVQIDQAGAELCLTGEETNPEGEAVVAVADIERQPYNPRDLEALGDYPHFVNFVLDQLTLAYGDDIYRGGFEVTTTLDSPLQEEAEIALRNRLRDLSGNGINTGAILVTDPGTGAVLAMVGSPDFDDEDVAGNLNYTIQYQEPAATILPLIYAAALNGVDGRVGQPNNQLDFGEYYTPASILWDVQTAYEVGGQVFRPTNDDGQFRGPISVRQALQLSLNIPAVETYSFVGSGAFVPFAQAMGVVFQEEETFGLGTALGATQVRLYDMVEAYGTIANDGDHVELYTILEIVDANGIEIFSQPGAVTEEVMPDAVAYLMQDIMSDDAARAQIFGTGTALNLNQYAAQVAAAKSGTSTESGDLWTLGFTSNRVVGVWMGTYNDDEVRAGVTGSFAAAPVWNEVLSEAITSLDVTAFRPPGNGTVLVTQVCPQTGAVNGPCGRNPIEVSYASERLPANAQQNQGIVRQVRVDSWTGLIANDNCQQFTETRVFAGVEFGAAVNWINETQQGRQYAQSLGLTVPVQRPPSAACDLNTPVPTLNIASPAEGATIDGQNFSITGQVIADNLAQYIVEYAPAGTNNFQQIAVSNQQQTTPNAVLTTWDTTSVPDGGYTLRLRAQRSGGGNAAILRNFQIDNPDPTPTPTPTITPMPTFTPIPSFTPIPPATAEPIPVDPVPFDPIPGEDPVPFDPEDDAVPVQP